MNYSSKLLFFLLLLISTVLSFPISLFQKNGSDNGVIELVMTYQDFSFYSIQLQLGFPLKTYNFFVDSASSDMLVGYPNVTDWCETCGSFEPSYSSTFQDMHTPFNMSYVSGDVLGFKGKDTISIDGQIIPEMELSVVTKGDLGYPMLVGLAPVGSENIYLPQYPNLGVRLTESGAINKNLFSIYGGTHLGTDDARLLFGGVDVAKYLGDLHELDMVKQVPQAYEINDYWVNLNGFSLSNNGIDSDLLNGFKNFTAIFDSGTSTILVPTDLYNYLVFDYFNVSDPYNDVVPCKSNDSFIIEFDNFKHKLPIESILFSVGENQCMIGLQPGAPHDTNIYFGIPVLQSLYTVFDTQSSKIYVAPIFITDKSEIKIIYNDTDIIALKYNESTPIGTISTSISKNHASSYSFSTPITDHINLSTTSSTNNHKFFADGAITLYSSDKTTVITKSFASTVHFTAGIEQQAPMPSKNT